MLLIRFLPFVLGICTVLQPALNRTLAKGRGLAFAVFLSSFGLFLCATLLLVLARFWPERVPDIFLASADKKLPLAWWCVLPGLLGAAVVTGVPLSLSRIGAVATFVGLLAGQMIVSLAWDALLENKPVTLIRVAGVVLSFAGAMLASRN